MSFIVFENVRTGEIYELAASEAQEFQDNHPEPYNLIVRPPSKTYCSGCMKRTTKRYEQRCEEGLFICTECGKEIVQKTLGGFQ